MQEKRVRSLIWEDPTCRKAAKPERHNCQACALGSVCRGFGALIATACAWQGKPPPWEARAPQLEIAPSRRN